MEFFLMIIFGMILWSWDKMDQNKQELQDSPIEDRKMLKKENIKFFLVIILHYCILVYVFILFVEMSNSCLKLIGYKFNFTYETRDRYARIASLIITVLKIPKLKRINLDKE